MHMDVRDAILKRRSIRSFKDIPIPRDVLCDILLAGQYAPSAGNLQNWRFMVVDDEGIKDRIAEACQDQSWIHEAPVVMVIVLDIDKMERFYPDKGNFYSIQTSAVVAENMIIMAESHGLASCFVSAFDEEALRQCFPGMTPNYKPQVVIPFGYANEKVPCPAKIDLTTVVFLNKFGGPGRVKDDFLFFNDYTGLVSNSFKKTGKGIKDTFKVIHSKLKKKLKK